VKIKEFLAGALCGALAGFVAASVVNHYMPMSSDEVLHKMKRLLKEEGKVIGSWILATPELVEKNSLTYKAYRGGITCLKDGKEVHYDFLVDSKTGMILELA